MPKRVRPYGSAEEALAHGRSSAGGDLVSQLDSTMTAREVAGQAAGALRELSELTSGGTEFASLDDVRFLIASLERMGQDLPQLCEQLARMLVVQREDGQLGQDGPRDPDFWVTEAVEALGAASQAADMMTAALAQARQTSGELNAPR